MICMSRCEEEKILAVVQYNRHGARVAKGEQNIDNLSVIFGQNKLLTTYGQEQHTLLGTYMRLKLVNEKKFLSSLYKKEEFEIYTTERQRTIYSALGFLRGLFPGSITKFEYTKNSTLEGAREEEEVPLVIDGGKMDYKKLLSHFGSLAENIKEIPLTILSKQNDIFHRDDCLFRGKKLEERIKENVKEKIFDVKDSEIKEAKEALSKALNISINSHKKFKQLLAQLQPQIYHYNTELEKLPFMTEKIIENIRKYIVNDKYYFRVRQRDEKKQEEQFSLLKIVTSEIFVDLVFRFEYALLRGEPKVTVFSTHDSTIIYIFSMIISYDHLEEIIYSSPSSSSSFERLIPQFASCVSFELVEVENEKYVRINYNNVPLTRGLKFIKDDQIKNGLIPYKLFVSMLERLINKDYLSLDCRGESVEKKKKKKNLKGKK